MEVIVPNVPRKKTTARALLAMMEQLSGVSIENEVKKIAKKHREPKPITENREKQRRLRQIEKGMLKVD